MNRENEIIKEFFSFIKSIKKSYKGLTTSTRITKLISPNTNENSIKKNNKESHIFSCLDLLYNIDTLFPLFDFERLSYRKIKKD